MRRERVSQVVKSKVFEISCAADLVPCLLDVVQWPTGAVTGENIRIFWIGVGVDGPKEFYSLCRKGSVFSPFLFCQV